MSNTLIIGATSAIAEHYARLQAARGGKLFLVGRNALRLQSIVADLGVRGSAEVTCTRLDLSDLDAHAEMLGQAWQWLQQVDVVLIAHGTLPDQGACGQDTALAVREFSLNGTATIALMNAVALRLRQQGSGTLAVISSVAGDRGRSSNYVYGSAKAAVSAFASGLRQQLDGHGVNVLTIKPGFVDTPMTREIRKGPLWAKPDRVALRIARAIDKRRSVVYAPGFWWAIMRVITHIPEVLFRRIKL